MVDPEDTETLSDMTVQAINAAIVEEIEGKPRKTRCFRRGLPFKQRKFSLTQKRLSLSLFQIEDEAAIKNPSLSEYGRP